MKAPHKQQRRPARGGAEETAHVKNFKFDSNANSAAVQRGQVLAQILEDIPGNTSGTQRARLMAAMLALGSVTSREGSRCLDCYDPRARIHELRNQGVQIITAIRTEVASGGEIRRVGVYVLKGGDK